MNRKLDSYFKEKLNQPQQAPTDAWDNIQSALDKKKKKYFIPFWIKISGVASIALLLIGSFMLINHLGTSTNQIEINSNLSPFEEFQSIVKSANNLTKNKSKNEYKNNNIEKQNNLRFKQIENYNTNESEVNNTSIENDLTEEKLIINNEWLNSLDNLNSLLSYSSNRISFTELNSIDEKLNNEDLNASLDIIFDSKLDNITLKKQEKFKPKKKQNIDFNKFSISGFISPMALNTFVGKSMLSDEMSDYKTDNNITLAYGIKGAYALNPKIKIRTGVSKIGFEQFTRNVPLIGNVSTNSSFNSTVTLQNINYNSQLRVVKLNKESLSNGELYLSTYGDMQQQSEYIEIPIEAEFTLFQNESIGISATGGGSTWLLSKNKIYVHGDNYTEELGKANNLNKTSFSANAGLKFDMKISEDIYVNIEPNFKYLINTVNNIDQYNPYTIGVNAGISVNLK